MAGKKGDKASVEDLLVMDTVEQFETYEDYLDSQVKIGAVLLRVSVLGGNGEATVKGRRLVREPAFDGRTS